ncbi:MAG: hypothetical protein ACLTXT_02820 [Ruminococcus callidus]
MADQKKSTVPEEPAAQEEKAPSSGFFVFGQLRKAWRCAESVHCRHSGTADVQRHYQQLCAADRGLFVHFRGERRTEHPAERKCADADRLEGKASISNIKDYAEQHLGLQKLDQSQIQYIDIQTEDTVEIDGEEQNILSGSSTSLRILWHISEADAHTMR